MDILLEKKMQETIDSAPRRKGAPRKKPEEVKWNNKEYVNKYHNNYYYEKGKEIVTCDICFGKSIRYNLHRHRKSKAHLRALEIREGLQKQILS